MLSYGRHGRFVLYRCQQGFARPNGLYEEKTCKETWVFDDGRVVDVPPNCDMRKMERELQ